MKHFTFLKPMLLLCALIVGVGSSWAEESIYKTALFGTDYNSNKVSSYTATWSATNAGFTVNLANFNNNNNSWAFIKCGRKNNASIGTITTADAIDQPITKVVVTVDACTSNNVNSFKLYVASDADFTQNKQEISATIATGENTFTVTSPAENMYYEIEIDCASGTSNGLVTISKIDYYSDNTASGKEATELIVEETVDMYVGDTKNVNDLYVVTDGYDGTVTLTSSDEEVAKIEGGQLVAVAAGTAVITVTAPSTENYNAAEAQEITVNVASKDVTPEGPSEGGNFELVTDAATLKAGDKLLLVNEEAAVAIGADRGNNRGAVTVTIDEHQITSAEGVSIITLEGSTDAWNFKVSDGYLYAGGAEKNYLKTRDEVGDDDNATATISIDEEGNATILFQGTNRPFIRFNPNNGTPIFSCYASTSTTGSLPQIYRAVEAKTFDIAIGETGYKTLVSTVDATLPEGLKAYVVTATSSESATLTEVAAIKANTPYILQGAEGDYTLTIAEKVDAPASNLLQISTESTGNGVYVLANGTDGVGFYKWNGGSLGAGRVYLPATAGARDFIGFSFGEATGINAVENAKENGAVYNLAGQRVAQPTRGLYIVNGKKFVVK